MKGRVATSLVALACAVFGGAAPAAESGLGATCASDAQCASGFCDRHRCAAPQGVYGRPCAPAPRGEDGLRDGKLNVCGAYVCALERCRSCSSAEQCEEEYGAPACTVAEGRPGARCGRL